MQSERLRKPHRGVMKTLTSIVAVSRKGAIGCKNELPWRLKSDLKFFRETTSNNVVILGRMTYESIGKCLPNRTNLVLSHNAVLFQDTDDCRVVCSIEESLFAASRYSSKETFVIGGASTYLQFSPLVDRYLITVVDKDVPDADAFLSEDVFGDPDNWNIRSLGEYPAVQGVDEAPFAVYEWTAKDAARRESLRRSLVDEFFSRNHLLKRSTKRAPSKGVLPQQPAVPLLQL
ncbi:dihydrofolate reductase [Sphingopyxis terrae subsp. ummariensis]|uniref:dihydrofolate reductase n=2 Tax=Sphingopyxis terrae TaxID=33052 RepID=A0A1Y6EV11_9SPHN|nr:dihydrofolate reductase [Sphingopyxis terrae subsp. ummariensis]